jgi:hypothetical protein
VKIQVTLADQQADPNSPLFSAKSFEDLNLHPNLLKGVYKMGFQKPSKIQEKALPLLLQNPCVFFSLLSCLTTFPSDTRPLILNLTLSQSPEHDRSVAVGNGQDRRLRLDDAVSSGHGPQSAPGASSSLSFAILLLLLTSHLAGRLYRPLP